MTEPELNPSISAIRTDSRSTGQIYKDEILCFPDELTLNSGEIANRKPFWTAAL